MIKIIDTNIKDVKIIKPQIFNDHRGYFFESFNSNEFHDKIGKINFIQDNLIISDTVNTQILIDVQFLMPTKFYK